MEFVSEIIAAIKTMDHFGDYHVLVHFVLGVFFGFFCGAIRPTIAFWGATFAGFGKETLDYVKHTHESASFHFLTDPKYGLYDGVGDLLLWMVGGYVAYRVWRRSHALVRAHHQHALQNHLATNTANIVNPVNLERHLAPGRTSSVSLVDCLHPAGERQSARLM